MPEIPLAPPFYGLGFSQSGNAIQFFFSTCMWTTSIGFSLSATGSHCTHMNLHMYENRMSQCQMQKAIKFVHMGTFSYQKSFN